jgi:hypothetical protein
MAEPNASCILRFKRDFGLISPVLRRFTDVLRVQNVDCAYEKRTKTTSRLVTSRTSIGAHETAVKPLPSMMWQGFFNLLSADPRTNGGKGTAMMRCVVCDRLEVRLTAAGRLSTLGGLPQSARY